MKKLLIIGKHGQIATALSHYASEQGFEAFAYSREELDILNPLQTEQRIKEVCPDVLINTAAYHVLADCQSHPEQAFAVNAAGVGRLAGLCREAGITFVTYSTDHVFDGTAGRPYREDDEARPLQVYGASKLAGERAALAAHPKGCFIIRTCGVYGGKQGSRSRGGNIVLTLLRESREKNPLEVASDQIASPSFADDVGRATLRLLAHPDAKPGIYHLVGEGQCSWYEFARELARLARLTNRIIPVERGEGDRSNTSLRRPRLAALENIKAKALGITLPSWRDALGRYVKTLFTEAKLP